jgi:hypothetical protein
MDRLETVQLGRWVTHQPTPIILTIPPPGRNVRGVMCAAGLFNSGLNNRDPISTCPQPLNAEAAVCVVSHPDA